MGWVNVQTPYDYGSVMHYNGYAFTMNGQPTITKRTDDKAVYTQRTRASSVDVYQVCHAYKCNECAGMKNMNYLNFTKSQMLTCHNDKTQYFWPSRCTDYDWVDCPGSTKAQNCNKSCEDLNTHGNYKVLKVNYSLAQSEASTASVQCSKGFKLNIPNKLRTKAQCKCDLTGCNWIFSRGNTDVSNFIF